MSDMIIAPQDCFIGANKVLAAFFGQNERISLVSETVKSMDK